MEDRPNLHDDGRKPSVENNKPDKPEEEAPELGLPLFRVPDRRYRPIRRVGKARKYRQFKDMKPKEREELVKRRLDKKLGELVQDQEIIIENPELHTHSKKSCQFCMAPFPRALAICPRCGNCQSCGLLVPDRQRQLCIFCGNMLKNMKKSSKNVRIRAKSYRNRKRKGV